VIEIGRTPNGNRVTIECESRVEGHGAHVFVYDKSGKKYRAAIPPGKTAQEAADDLVSGLRSDRWIAEWWGSATRLAEPQDGPRRGRCMGQTASTLVLDGAQVRRLVSIAARWQLLPRLAGEVNAMAERRRESLLLRTRDETQLAVTCQVGRASGAGTEGR
jgi:hypothetical protein